MLTTLASVPYVLSENPLFILEALLLLAGFLAFGPRRRRRVVLRTLEALARRKGFSVALVGVLALGGRLALLPMIPIPEPYGHDQFSYLLAADTFASGRLTNPPHPLWVHFETMHVNHQPTYMSMYPPAQGMVLALGKVVFGHPWWGVWLSAGLMCAAICWALQAWLPPVWALAGGLLAVVRLGWFSYWMNSYWGGTLGALGGALVLGAAARIVKRARARDAWLFGLGLFILAFSRPYEGLLVAAPAGLWALLRAPRARILAPLAAVLVVTAAAMAYYNWRLTGNALRMPYQLNRNTYVQARYFLWEPINTRPVYRHEEMRDFYVGWQLDHALKASTPEGFAEQMIRRTVFFWAFYLGPLLTVPLLAFHRVVRDRRMRPLIIIGAVTLAGLTVNLFFVQHYAAPATALLYALLLQGWRHLRQGRPAFAAAISLVCVAMLAVRLGAEPVARRLMPSELATWFHSPKGFHERAAVLRRLEAMPGEHLVIVRYGAGHDPDQEWVYNAADIDRARVVWARDMGDRNRELLDYFSGRQVWVLEADARPPRLAPIADDSRGVTQ